MAFACVVCGSANELSEWIERRLQKLREMAAEENESESDDDDDADEGNMSSADETDSTDTPSGRRELTANCCHCFYVLYYFVDLSELQKLTNYHTINR